MEQHIVSSREEFGLLTNVLFFPVSGNAMAVTKAFCEGRKLSHGRVEGEQASDAVEFPYVAVLRQEPQHLGENGCHPLSQDATDRSQSVLEGKQQVCRS